MYVRRDYSTPLYGKPRRTTRPALVMLLLVLIGGIVGYSFAQFDTLQAEALKVVGMAGDPTPYPGQYATWAAEKFATGDLQGARSDYAHAVSLQPTNLDYLYEYGRVLIDLGLSTEASQIADDALAAAPSDVRGYALKANALMWSNPDQAIQYAKQGTDIDPNFAWLYAAMAIAYNELEFYDLALEYGADAIELDPNDARGYSAYAWPLIYNDRTELAITYLEKAVALAPNLTNTYFELAFWYKSPSINQPLKALGVYETLLQRNLSAEDRAKANLRMCETLASGQLDPVYGTADFDVAEPYCQEAINVKPDYGPAYKELGRMRYVRRNYEGSIEAFDTCVALGATNIECWYLRGIAYWYIGNCDMAWQVLNEANVLANEQGVDPYVFDQIDDGLYNVRYSCPDYQNMPEPTAIPPTMIPPTPIGGL
jgi:tetratricopeptide (TPR) repeat protein